MLSWRSDGRLNLAANTLYVADSWNGQDRWFTFMLACRSWMRHFHGARPRCSSRFLWWCWRASFRSACCLLSCLCFSSSLCTHMQKKCHYFNILQCVRVQSCYMLLSLLTGEDCLLYSDTSLWISIKYEIHLTSLSCLFSSLFFSAALRFSSSLSHCLCSSAAFISAWKVAFFLLFSDNYNVLPILQNSVVVLTATPWSLTSCSSSFFLLSSSISFLRSARWRARASMASERGRGVSVLLWYKQSVQYVEV